MKIHFYGKLDSLESCYTYQAFDIEGVTLFLQNAPRFGFEPATMTIKNPAMFIKKEDGYYRFVIEDFEVEIKDGSILIKELELKKILGSTIPLI